jgi:hypothetical protein
MTMQEERLRYEAAMEFAREALAHIHQAFSGSNKLMMLNLAECAMARSKHFMGEIGVKLDTDAAATLEYKRLTDLNEQWTHRLAGVCAIETPHEVIEVDFR